ncbi:serine-rich adhesin for platelets-like isoform X7 [Myxocyprinus asiaticus]|uniref:serine-rich adhesin for platelets-like isoform X7 n=1 Tax=Myxocyprinus asiaticus TaxID=70543 RepID=UPI002221543B|nr:serine-rich adhesin for platelets-like isoform X7 [Myxocyprinus asiaticus]
MTMASPSASTSTEIPNFTTFSTLVPKTTEGVTTMTSASTSTPMAETSSFNTFSTLNPNPTEGVTTMTSASTSTPTAETSSFTTLSTLVPNTTEGVVTKTSASTSTQTAETSSSTTLSTLVPNTSEGVTKMTSASTSTPTSETPSSTTLSTLVPNTTEGVTTMTSSSTSTLTSEMPSFNTLSTLIPNTTEGVKTLTIASTSTPTPETPSSTTLSTLVPNTSEGVTKMTSASTSTPTSETPSSTTLSTLVPNTSEGVTKMTSASTSTPTSETPSSTTLSTLVPNTSEGVTKMTSASTSTPTSETPSSTTLSTLVPNTSEGVTKMTSASTSTLTSETPSSTTLSTLVPNTSEGVTKMTSASTSTPTSETPSSTTLSTLVPSTTEGVTTMTSASTSTLTSETPSFNIFSALIPNTTEGVKTLTIASTSTPTPETPSFITLSTLVPNTTEGVTTMTSSSTSTPTAETSSFTTLSTLVPNTTEGVTTMTSASTSTPTSETPSFTTLSTLVPNTTKRVTTMTRFSISTPTAKTSKVTILTTLFTNTTEIIKTSATPTSIPPTSTATSTPTTTTMVASSKPAIKTTPSQTSTTKQPTPITKPPPAATTAKPTTKPPPTIKPTTKPPPTIKPKTKPPPTTTKSSTTIKPPLTTRAKPTTKPSPPPTRLTTPNPVTRQMSLAIDETFDSSLNNKNSEKFKGHKSKIEAAIKDTYKNEKNFVSATVTGFRPGSVIVDFFITSSQEIQSNEAINQALSSNLKQFQFNVDPASIAATEWTNLVKSREAVFPEQKIQLYCPTTDHLGGIEWTVQGKQVQLNSHYELSADGLYLTVNNVNKNDNGRYECLYKTNTGLHRKWDEIDFIKPYPSMQTPANKTFKCVDQMVQLSCCVHSNYSVNWVEGTKMLSTKSDFRKCSTYLFSVTSESCGKKNIFICILDNKDLLGFSYSSKAVELVISAQQSPNSPVTCNDNIYGFGNVGINAIGDCEGNKIGSRKGICQPNGTWTTTEDDCVLRIIEELKQESQALNTATLTTFVHKVNNATTVNKADIVQSSATVANLVEILNTIADVSQNIQLDEAVITDFLEIVEVISSEATKPVWEILNTGGVSQGNSSQLLNAIENVLKAASNDSFNIISPTNAFLFRKITTSNSFFKDVLKLNSTAEIGIPDISSNATVTTAAFSTLNNIMPVRNRTDNSKKSVNVINGLIVVVKTSVTISNISLSFQKLNNSGNIANSQCVFWDFKLFNGTGGWDSTGCERIHDNGSITCRCNHTTSFSILMSPSAPEDLALSVITYVGVGISLASLVVCLIIEIIIWKDISRNATSHMRHVFMVNIALSLLIADVLFIIGAAITKPGKDIINPCSAVVFFTHFFYLALFFWMLVSALLLLYRTTMVFSHMSKSVMLAIAFSVGYGAPLIISIITVAVTVESKSYITRSGTCWLNWDISNALLAFVVPALIIVAVNIAIVIMVVIKLVRRRVGENSRDERNVLTAIVRCVAILTPIFGITWGLGFGIMFQPKALAIHYLFAIFNSMQGFFILVLGILMEKKVREALISRFRNIGSSATHSSSFRTYNNSASNRTTFTNVINTLLRRERHARSPTNLHSGASESFMNA